MSPPSEAVQRIALEQLDQALAHTEAKARLDDAVHDVRVCFKKLRALIRLIRKELGKEQYQRENIFYRDLNRGLSNVRDTATLTEILDKLTEHFADELAEGVFDSIRNSLKRATRKRQVDKKRTLVAARRKIHACRERVKKWSIKAEDFSAVGFGLAQVYSRGRGGFGKAQSKSSVKSLHEWRKEVKYLWYQVSLLRPVWSKPLKGFAKQIKQLVDCLSDDHDLAILRERVLADSDHFEDRTEREALMALIDRRRTELESDACILGQRIYAEKAKDFRARFHEYWRAWQSEKSDEVVATSNINS